jgi:hypothetical protein
MSDDYNQWSTVKPFLGSTGALTSWIPQDDRDRIAAYLKYDQMYWNDARQYALRVLEGEQPLYIPNARTIVDTTSHYLLKGLQITTNGPKATKDKLDAFLKREAFYSRFNLAKQSGVARGDFVFHLTGNPKKANGTKLSLTAVDPSSVFPIYDDDQPDKMIGCHIAIQYYLPNEPDKTRVRKLTYRLVEDDRGKKRISREEGIYELEPSWFGDKAKLVKQVIPLGFLDDRITVIPVYWFRNRHWQGEDFGSSELRGLEAILETISQGSTDVSASLALEGLGVYATDGGRPVDNDGNETDWEVAPGRVMEVPSGSYFRRVEGVGSITPAVDQIKYLEDKIHEASGLGDVALGKVDAQVASSGIALAIKFIPTLAKIEVRDQLGIDILTQLFYDWKTWYAVFEKEPLEGDIIPVIGDKLPTDRTAKVNELNNMMDRRVISTAFYRKEMEKLGYVFPSDSVIEKQIASDLERASVAKTPQQTSPEDNKDESGKDSSTNGDTLEEQNSSNNSDRPNESSGTEANSKTRDA